MLKKNQTAVLLLSCPDQVGIVYHISQFIFSNGGNIIDLNEHVDRDENIFFIRVAWQTGGKFETVAEIKKAFAPLAKKIKAHWEIKSPEEKMRVAVFVSKYDHCLNEILWRYRLGEFPIVIPLIISNHPDLQKTAELDQIPFYHLPINKDNKPQAEAEQLTLLNNNAVDAIVLARYMQILSPDFVAAYPNRIINIHHSFLPAFVGGNPYRQAYQRGVKIIGATSHYITAELDEGPIIEQDIIRISHRDSLQDLIRKGRDLERLVLARALQLHFEHRILVQGNKTVVFS